MSWYEPTDIHIQGPAQRCVDDRGFDVFRASMEGLRRRDEDARSREEDNWEDYGKKRSQELRDLQRRLEGMRLFAKESVLVEENRFTVEDLEKRLGGMKPFKE